MTCTTEDKFVEQLRFLASGQNDPQSVALAKAADEIERLREAANDLAQYVSRADWYHYVKPETRAALGEKE